MQSKSKEFDLLKGKNDLFYVTFDTLTPRPHFIIAPKDPTGIPLDFGEMKPEQTKKLLEAVQSTMQVMSGYKIDSGILSFHRGSWFTKHPKRTFHAHICVDDELYLKVFAKNRNEIAQSLSWNQYKCDQYCGKVSAYKTKQEGKYFPKAKSNIEGTNDVKKLPTFVKEGFTQVLHPSHPKIGFVGKRNIQPGISLQAIEKFAKDLDLIDIAMDNKDDDKGCQVCLYLGPVPTEEGWSQTAQDEEVLGYIVISGPLFYQFCPDKEYREKWFLNFKKCKFVCLT